MTQPTIADVMRLIEAAKEWAYAGNRSNPLIAASQDAKLFTAISALPHDAGEYCVVPRHIVQECLEAEEHENKWALSQYLRGELRACLKGTT